MSIETIEYRTVDKSDWEPGPWQDEPDKVQWQDEENGFACLAVRSEHGGNWCGYVGIPQGHPLYQVDYSEYKKTERVLDRRPR